MILSTARLEEDDIDTEDISEEGRQINHYVCVCEGWWVREWEEIKGGGWSNGREGDVNSGMPLLGVRTCRAHEC